MIDKVSFIIPVHNEESVIGECLTAIFEMDENPYEVLVVDANSADGTVEIASNFDCRILQSPTKGRAAQLDFGSRHARGSILVYLHADTCPHPETISLVTQALKNHEVVLGAFQSIMQGEKSRRLISFHNAIKTYYAPFFYNPYRSLFKGLRLLFGDQVMFCRKADYLRSGGFDLTEKVMEEAAFCLRMNQLGRIIQLNEKVFSSDRRVVEWGPLKAHFLYIAICAAWGLGVSSERLAKLYPDIR